MGKRDRRRVVTGSGVHETRLGLDAEPEAGPPESGTEGVEADGGSVAAEPAPEVTPSRRRLTAAGGDAATICFVTPGQVLNGHYRLVREIARGGMGIVFEAEDVMLQGRRVAVKVLPPEVAKDRSAVLRLQREASAVCALDHSGIVRLIEFNADGDTHYLVMEYLNGEDLAFHLASNERLPLAEVLDVARQVCPALVYAHGRGVLHRDIKPANLMFKVDGDHRHVKITDFGIASQVKDSMTRLTGQESAGTLLYIAPEQLRGTKASTASDQYSLAVTLYELLSGEPPFTGGGLSHQILEAKPAPLSDVPAHVNDAIMRALSKEPEGRFADCGAFLDALEGRSAAAAPARDGARPAAPGAAASGGGRSHGAEPAASSRGGSRLVVALLALVALAVVAWGLGFRGGSGWALGPVVVTPTVSPTVSPVASTTPTSTPTRPATSRPNVDSTPTAAVAATEPPPAEPVAAPVPTVTAALVPTPEPPTPSPVPPTPPPTPEAPKGFGMVYLTSEPPGALVWLDGKATGFRANTDTIKDVPAGRRSFELRLPLYKPASLDLDVGVGDLMRPDKVVLAPDFGGLKVEGAPAGGRVRLTSLDRPDLTAVELGFGETKEKLSSGRWLAEASAADHEGQRQDVTVPADGSVIPLRFDLVVKRTDVVVDSKPHGAEVTWDGTKLQGTTPVKVTDVSVGGHRVTMEKRVLDAKGVASGVLFFEGDVRVEDEKPFLVEKTLAPRAVRVTFESEPAGAKVYCVELPSAQKYVGRTGEGVVAVDLEPGTWTIKYVLSGYRDALETVVVGADPTPRTVRRKLEEEHGVIEVSVVPTDAALVVDGERQTLKGGSGRLSVKPGSHRLAASRDGYEDAGETVTVADGATVPSRLVLRKKPKGPPVPVSGRVGEPWTNSVGMQFSWCPPGEFDMGGADGEAFDCEGPVHRVRIPRGFWMGTHEVTQGQWQAVMGSNPANFKGDDRRPVERVSWNDCQGFVGKLVARDGNGYRLPSEAEWEYACRAGTAGARYGDLDAVAWYYNNSAFTTHAVGGKRPNPWGLHDTLGNVLEWCQDTWHGDYSGAPTDGSAWDGGSGNRVLRGGSWFSYASCARATYRCHSGPDDRYYIRGLRVIVLPRTP